MLAEHADPAVVRQRTDRAWETFLRKGEIDGVAPEIARSWRRARELYAVDPGLRRAPLLPPAELQRRLEQDETLEIAAPVLADFSARLRDKGHVLAFFDAEGWMLSIGGDPRVADRGAEINFRPGGLWREEAAGTNGCGTALVELRPVEVFASEHFVRAWQPWTSAGAPVLAPGGGLAVGVVDVAGPWDARDPQALVASTAIASVVEERLRGMQGVRDEIVRYAMRAARASGDALVAVDARGRLLQANDAARRRLGLEGAELPAEARERLGRALRAAPDDEFPLDWPGLLVAGEERPRAVCSPVSHLGRVVGAVVRVLPGALAAPGRGARARGRGPAGARYGFAHVLGASEKIQSAVRLAQLAARNDLPVVLHGESGTGKELFAHGVHAESSRARGPFVPVNCGAIPAPLVEAELFGYEAGTFTGGQRDGRAGRLEEASGGTLFLDEVSELSPQAQTALLRVLQESEVTRLGGSHPRHVDVRVVAATNKRLYDEVAAGRFRHDLFFRLNVLAIDIPPLRDRPGDVAILARAFLDEAAERVGRAELELSGGALAALDRHPWPGNVRELRNVMMRAAATAAGVRVEEGELQLVEPRGVAPGLRLPAPLPAQEPDDAPLADAAGPDKDELVAALDRCGWNIARTATTLGVSRMTLYRRLRKFGITR